MISESCVIVRISGLCNSISELCNSISGLCNSILGLRNNNVVMVHEY